MINTGDFKIGDKVKIDCDGLDFYGLTPETNCTGNDYLNYIYQNKEKEYTIKCFDESCSNSPIILDDELLSQTSFNHLELIKVICDVK